MVASFCIRGPVPLRGGVAAGRGYLIHYGSESESVSRSGEEPVPNGLGMVLHGPGISRLVRYPVE